MNKIPTLFDRDWNGNHKVIDKLDPRLQNKEIAWSQAICTEKFDGTNVAITIQNKIITAYWKRRNPTKQEKEVGKEPWYVLVDFKAPENKYIISAFQNTDFSFIDELELPDGLYSAEALGPKIQGNPYQLEKHQLVFFSIPQIIKQYSFSIITHDFNDLKNMLPNLHSFLGDMPIEGLVWHFPDGSMIKIKTKDFDYSKE